jgi:hypothetical protein
MKSKNLGMISTLSDPRGVALAIVLFAMTTFLATIGAALFFARVELKKSLNLRYAAQTLATAEAGLEHGLASIPWIMNFSGQLGCGKVPCDVTSTSSWMSGFSYEVTIENDAADSGGPSSDTNTSVVVVAEGKGPENSKRIIQAYVKRSTASFTPPGAIYVNGDSSTPQVDSSNSSATGYFDLDNNNIVNGNDTNINGSSGSQASIWGIAARSSTVVAALKQEYTGTYSSGYTGAWLHDVIGRGSEPSIGAVSDSIDINLIGANFYSYSGAVKYMHGLITDSVSCPSSSPCTLGTSSAPQVTYIKESYDSDAISLKGSVTGYGVLILEGRVTLGDNFKFYGLVVHNRATASHYFSIEDSSRIYGGLLVGAFDEEDGKGKKSRFGIKDAARIYYSSEALATVDSNWGLLLPKPARIFAWMDKY